MKHIQIELKKPFAHHNWRKGAGGKELVYIDARQVMNRLDEVFDVGGWQAHYEHIGGRMICKLSCLIGDKWVTKSDGAGDTNIEGDKGGISDALKRAAVLWGIGGTCITLQRLIQTETLHHGLRQKVMTNLWKKGMVKRLRNGVKNMRHHYEI